MGSGSMATIWDTFLSAIWEVQNDGLDQDSAQGESFLTRKGVTRMSWDYARHQGIVPDVPLEQATTDQLATVLRMNFWNAMQCDRFCNAGAAGIAVVLGNIAMMSGVGRATRILQQVAGTVQDGLLGPKTVAAALAKDHDQMVGKLTDAYVAFLRGLNTWATFGRGWLRRVEEFERLALATQASHA